jgi:histidyl-tRNA synthetase
MEFNPYGERQIRKALPDDFDSPVVAELIALGEAVAGAVGERAESGIPLTFDPFLVRGMGYYTGVIVEAMHPGEGYSLGGGGRYDGMIGRFLGTDVPASGFSIGFERIVDLVSLREVEAADAVALLFDEGADPARLLALKAELIASGTRVRLERAPRNVKALLDSLAASGYGRFAHVGDAETAADLSFKPLTTGS